MSFYPKWRMLHNDPGSSYLDRRRKPHRMSWSYCNPPCAYCRKPGEYEPAALRSSSVSCASTNKMRDSIDRVIVTTLLCPRKVCKTALGQLFRQRWNVELDLRAIKTTLQMAELSCNTPQMNEKELWVHFLAYNLIRMLMAQAAAKAAVHPRHLS